MTHPRFLLIFIVYLFVANISNATDVESLTQQQSIAVSRLESELLNKNSEQLVRYWDSLNINHHNTIYQKVPAKTWQSLFEKKYSVALQDKDSSTQFLLAFPLMNVYYVQAKFKESFPLIIYLYNRKAKLSRKKYATILIKLEETYRFYKDFAKALSIRNERVENGFTQTFWELYKLAGLYKEAIQDFKLFETKPVHPIRDRLNYYIHLGDLFFEDNQLDSAEKYYQSGIIDLDIYLEKIRKKEIIEEGNFIYYRGWLSGLIANCWVEKGKYKQAKPLLEYFLNISPTDLRMNSMLPLSICYLHLGEISKGKLYLDSVKYYLSDRMYGPAEYQYLKAKSFYFSQINNNDSAYYYLNQYENKKELFEKEYSKNKSLLLLVNLEIQKRREDLMLTKKDLSQTKTLAEVKQRQLYISLFAIFFLTATVILLLINYRLKVKSKKLIEQKNIELQYYAEKNLQKSKHNEQLIKELHHRVKNNLQNIYSLLSIQKRRIRDTDTMEYISSIQNRISSMAIVHESLYSDENADYIDFEDYAKNLINHIKYSFERDDQQVQISFNIVPLQLPLEKIILLGLILNEAISNSFKYALVSNSLSININVVKNEEFILLNINDNGPGFNTGQVNEKSLGLKLIQIMSMQLDAQYELDNKKGVSHTLKFKL